jgi:predicted membrane protein
MNRISRIILGICFLIFIILVSLNMIGVLSFNRFFSGWWTLFIIVPSISYIVTSKNKYLSILTFTVGILLLMASLNIIDFLIIWHLFVPISIALITLVFISKFLFSSEKNKKSEEYSSVFGREKKQITKKINGAIINTIFGSLYLDLTKSNIDHDIAFDVTSLFGSTVIELPTNVNVIVKSNNLFGTTKNLKKNDKKNEDTIFISSKSIFGGVIIK